MHTHGFFYVVGHGYTPEQVCPHPSLSNLSDVSAERLKTARMFGIADIPFSAVPAEEKQVYAGTMKQTGSYQGYKLRQYWVRVGRHDPEENRA